MRNRHAITTALVLIWTAAAVHGAPPAPVPVRIPPLDSLAANIVRLGAIPGAGGLPVLAAASGWYGRIDDIRVLDPGGPEFRRILADDSGTWCYCGWAAWPERDGAVLVLAPPPYCLPGPLAPTVAPGDTVAFDLVGYDLLPDPAAALLTPSGTVEDLLPDGTARFSFRADERGVYWIEVLENGPNGPAVSLLFPVISGGDAADVLDGGMPVGSPGAATREQVLADLDSRRAASGAPPLQRSAALDSIAGLRASALALSGSNDHLSEGRGLEQMLPPGVGPFAENIARGGDFRECWSMILISPFHLRSCVSPDYRHVGIGAAVDWGDGEWQLVMVLVLTGEAPAP